MKKLKFPTPYTVLVIVMCLAAALTYLLPAGGYDTLWYDKDKDVFVIQSADKTYEEAATKEALTSRNISISLDKFKDQKIKNPIPTSSGKLHLRVFWRFFLLRSREFMRQ